MRTENPRVGGSNPPPGISKYSALHTSLPIKNKLGFTSIPQLSPQKYDRKQVVYTKFTPNFHLVICPVKSIPQLFPQKNNQLAHIINWQFCKISYLSCFSS